MRAALAALAVALLLAATLAHASVPAGTLVADLQSAGGGGGPVRDDRFFAIGSEQCRVCHRAIFEAWIGTAHATADSSLSPDERSDAACQPCHLPYPEVDTGIGCEACHGQGSSYSGLAVMIDPLKRNAAGLWNAAASCALCHNPGHPFHVKRNLQALSLDVHRAPPLRRIQ